MTRRVAASDSIVDGLSDAFDDKDMSSTSSAPSTPSSTQRSSNRWSAASDRGDDAVARLLRQLGSPPAALPGASSDAGRAGARADDPNARAYHDFMQRTASVWACRPTSTMTSSAITAVLRNENVPRSRTYVPHECVRGVRLCM